MNNKMITTNVRTSVEDMMLAKEMASDMGMSFNGYINWLMKKASVVIPLGGEISDIKKKIKLSIWDLPKLAKKYKNRPMGTSEDDEAVYY